jgi:dGTPase
VEHICAVPDSVAKDRPHPEPEAGMAPGFGLDRWRVFNCSAFRRLQYKTQVFVIDEGDHYRTRLTHTLEVAQISRLLAERLGLNPVLTEVIAIVHDLGHPPFGHAGEAALHELMSDHGGFDHNVQALRVIDLLEHPYRHFHGLNLANVVRWAHQLHATAKSTIRGQGTPSQDVQAPCAAGGGSPEPDVQAPCAAGGRPPQRPRPPNTGRATNKDNDTAHPEGRTLNEDRPWQAAPDPPAGWRQQPLEGQVTNLADRIAYNVHDVEDALAAELVSEDDLQDVRLWRLAAEPVRRQWPDLPLAAVRRHILDAMARRLVDDLVAATERNLEPMAADGWEAFCRAEAPTVTLPGETEAMLAEHEAFLAERAYGHPRVAAMDYKARLIIRALFNAHAQQPRLLPVRYFDRIERQGLHRVVCDYVAGMTDRFCQDAYHNLFEPFPRL